MADNRSDKISNNADRICKLATSHNIDALKQFLHACDEETKGLAVSLLAKENDMTTLNNIKDILWVQKTRVIVGLAWGGHTQSLNEYLSSQRWPIYEIEGYALGRHIEQVNDIISHYSDRDESHMIGTAIIFYEEGGHTQNLPDTLELITRTMNRRIKEGLIRSLKKILPSVDDELLLAKADKLSMLMQQHKIDYQRALAILTDVETQESTAKPNENKIILSSESVRLFHSAAQATLTVYQTRAVEQLGQFGLTENIMLNWKPHARDKEFSYNHLQALRFLLSDQKVEPAAAVREISQLNAMHVTALLELYSSGLRGEYLREWQQRESRLVFSQELLEKLMRMTLQEKKDPIAALNEISDSRQKEIPAMRKAPLQF